MLLTESNNERKSGIHLYEGCEGLLYIRDTLFPLNPVFHLNESICLERNMLDLIHLSQSIST